MDRVDPDIKLFPGVDISRLEVIAELVDGHFSIYTFPDGEQWLLFYYRKWETQPFERMEPVCLDHPQHSIDMIATKVMSKHNISQSEVEMRLALRGGVQ